MEERERQKIVVDWNQTARDFPDDRCIHQLFEEQVDLNPDATALEFHDKQLSYRALDETANRLARHLIKLGAKPEVRIGLCMERGLGLAISVLGILKSGAAYVPFDPKLPKERLDFILQDASLQFIVTESRLIHRFDESQFLVIAYDRDLEQISKESAARPKSAVQSLNLAYVIYTSGSTGMPKGVIVPHQGVCNMGISEVTDFRIKPESRVLLVAPIIFDVSLFEMVMTWFAGATLILAGEEEIITGSVLNDKQVTNAAFTPSLLATLRAHDFPSVRSVISVGEACTEKIVAEWAPGRRLLNVYGPTETTGHCSYAELHNDGTGITIGRPIMNARIYILDTALNPVPIGEAGELHISSAGMTRGYLNRPDLTALRFIPDPFSTGKRLYKTGDRAQFRQDGNIEFLGRIDYQVKIRGFRIELGDIEAALLKLDDVLEAVVIVREDKAGHKKLIAFVVGSVSLDESVLKQGLNDLLPDYMVPARILTLSEMPLNSSGKLDRSMLPHSESVHVEGIKQHKSLTNTEKTVAEVWSKVLEQQDLDIQGNFFDIGGDSLMFPVIFVEISNAFNVEIKIEFFMSNPTISAMADYIDNMRTETSKGLNK